MHKLGYPSLHLLDCFRGIRLKELASQNRYPLFQGFTSYPVERVSYPVERVPAKGNHRYPNPLGPAEEVLTKARVTLQHVEGSKCSGS